MLHIVVINACDFNTVLYVTSTVRMYFIIMVANELLEVMCD